MGALYRLPLISPVRRRDSPRKHRPSLLIGRDNTPFVHRRQLVECALCLIIKFGRTRKDAVDALQVSSHSDSTVRDDEDISPIAIPVNHYRPDKA